MSKSPAPKPTIALVNGPAMGGGVGLVAACDIAIASEDAFFALSEVRLGLIPAVISPFVVEAIGAVVQLQVDLADGAVTTPRKLKITCAIMPWNMAFTARRNSTS